MAFQYAVSEVIGVQTPSNLAYLSKWASPNRRVEVLHNWLGIGDGEVEGLRRDGII